MGGFEIRPGEELGDDSVGDELKGSDDQYDPDEQKGSGTDVLAEAELHPSKVR
jgi:hypothetical protein